MDREQCRYNTECYRRNPEHLRNRSHSHLDGLLDDFIREPNFNLSQDKISQYGILDPNTVLEQLAIMRDSRGDSLEGVSSGATAQTNKNRTRDLKTPEESQAQDAQSSVGRRETDVKRSEDPGKRQGLNSLLRRIERSNIPQATAPGTPGVPVPQAVHGVSAATQASHGMSVPQVSTAQLSPKATAFKESTDQGLNSLLKRIGRFIIPQATAPGTSVPQATHGVSVAAQASHGMSLPQASAAQLSPEVTAMTASLQIPHKREKSSDLPIAKRMETDKPGIPALQKSKNEKKTLGKGESLLHDQSTSSAAMIKSEKSETAKPNEGTTIKTIGVSRQTRNSGWYQGTVCKVVERAVFVKPVTALPEDYTEKDVYMRPDALGSSLLAIKRGDRLEFVLGNKDQDKVKPRAFRVRLLGYAPRGVAELQEYLEQYLEKLENTDSNGRQALLLDTLPCKALWELLGDSIFPKNTVKVVDYMIALLGLIVRLMDTGKINRKLIEGMTSTLLQGALFRDHDDKVGLPAAIRDNPMESYFHERVTDLCMGVARHVPDAARALLPTVKALCVSMSGEKTPFLLDLLQMLLLRGGSCLPELSTWNEMPLVPGSKELADQLVVEDPHLSRVKMGSETYSGSEEYMDTYFRLLRAETFASIQRGIKDLKNSELDPRDMHVYFKIQLSGYEVHNAVFSLALQFTPAKPVTKWEASPQLMFGNLLCLSPNRTFEDAIWATVSNRDTNLLNKSQLITVELLDCNTLSVSDVISSLQLNDGLTVMVESPTYFHALRPVLNSLQKFEMEDFPLKNEIVHANSSTNLPAYLDSAQTINTKAIEANVTDAWDVDVDEFLLLLPRNFNTLLESSQSEALVHALSNRLAIVQGPPGCGKTFLGVKIVQLLLSLQPQLTGPVLLLTYKNHALDEFLKAMLQFCEKENIVRIGGRCKEPQLEECNLQTILKNERYTQARFNEIQDIRIAIGDKTEEIKSIAGTIRNSSFLTRESLLQEMSEAQVVSFIRDAGWNKTTLVYRPSPKIWASREWVAKLVISIEQVTTVKTLVLHCFKEGVPKDNTDARYCFELFNKALETWIPDRKQLAELRNLEARFVKESYDDVDNAAGINIEQKKRRNDNDDDEYDEEEVQALLDARLSSLGSDGRGERKRDNLVLFEKNSAAVLVSLQDYPQDMEPSSAILAVENLWSLKGMQRFQFLYTILYNRSHGTADKLGELLAELEELRDRKQGIETHHKLGVLQSKKIVGVTITGASINHDLLQLLGPSVVIVEEAAEILEPSLLAALTPQLQHLILIGDHQQLRPNVDTYKLTTDFNFNVSLMERLIKSNFPYKTLAKQNRMRPEFSALLHDIYPKLEDNLPRVSQNKPLGCLDKSMFFWTHNHTEKKERTITNEKEAEMVASLVLYLLSSGCKPNEVTVLAAYLGQVKTLRGKIKKHRIDYPELHPNDEQVTVQTIDMYQGDENKYVVVSLVRCNDKGSVGFLSNINRRCVAQSRAKCGMYFVGSADTLRGKEQGRRCWEKLLTGMEEQRCVGSKITLQCWKHKERSCKHAESASDVKSVVDDPLSLCKLQCGDQMPCKIPGHVCRKSCAPRHAHTLCTIIVQDTFPSCGHPVQRKCYELLNNLLCDTRVSYVFPDCNHVSSKKCHVNPTQLKCMEMVDYHFPGCNHPSSKKKKCSEKITWKCDKKEKFTKKDCGHELFRICQQKEEDVVCNVPCGRNRPGCGHPCTNLCGEDCSKGDCKICVEKQREKMEKFHDKAKRRIEEIKEKLKKEKEFSIEQISRDGAGSAEFQKVEDQVLKYIQPCHNWYPTVHKIEKVTNLKLEKRFEEAKSRAFGDNIDTKFHGTSDEGVAGITRDGFRLPDQNPPPGKRGMYGQGIYFATDSSKSAQVIYTKDSNKLLVCQVLLGRSMIVRKADPKMDKAKLRKGRCDSVYAPRGSDVMNDEFVIFDPAQALPQYIVHYSTTGLPPPQQLPAAGQPFIKKNMKPSRTVDPNDPFQSYYNLAAQHYLSKCQTKKEIESIDVVINNQLLQKFEAKQKEFKSKGIPDGEILAYHGTRSANIDSILRNNLDIKFAQRQAYGRGNYFSEFPEISMGYGDGLLLCRVLPGREWVDNSGNDILQGYDSKKVLHMQRGQPAANAFGDMVIIENSDQILPYFVMHLK